MTNAQVNPVAVAELAPVAESATVQTLAPVAMSSLKTHFGARMMPTSSLADAVNVFALNAQTLDIERHAFRIRVLTAQSGGANHRDTEAMDKAFTMAGAASPKRRAQLNALSDVLAQTEGLTLKGLTLEAAILTLENLQNQIAECFIEAPKVARKPATNWKSAYAALYVHCKANGFTLPVGIPTP